MKPEVMHVTLCDGTTRPMTVVAAATRTSFVLTTLSGSTNLEITGQRDDVARTMNRAERRARSAAARRR